MYIGGRTISRENPNSTLCSRIVATKELTLSAPRGKSPLTYVHELVIDLYTICHNPL